MTKDEALTLEALKYAASKGYGRIVREMKIAPFTIKCEEALAQRTEQEPVACERCKQLEEHAYDLVGKLRVANIKLSMLKEKT
jgi:hypothetical protein